MSESLCSFARALVLGREDRQHAVELAQRRIGAANNRREVRASGRQAGAEVVEDQTEALRERQALDVVDHVEVHGLAVVLDRQQVLAGTGLPVGNLLQRRGRARSPGPAAWVT